MAPVNMTPSDDGIAASHLSYRRRRASADQFKHSHPSRQTLVQMMPHAGMTYRFSPTITLGKMTDCMIASAVNKTINGEASPQDVDEAMAKIFLLVRASRLRWLKSPPLRHGQDKVSRLATAIDSFEVAAEDNMDWVGVEMVRWLRKQAQARPGLGEQQYISQRLKDISLELDSKVLAEVLGKLALEDVSTEPQGAGHFDS